MNKRNGNERQKHGLVNEDVVKAKYKLNNYNNKNHYTAKYDAEMFDGSPVSIKTEKLGSDVELGDYFRNASKQEDFYMVVCFWEGCKSNIVEEYHVKFPVEDWRGFFNHSLDSAVRGVIDRASNEYSYDSIWKREIKELKELYGNHIIRLRPKRDHKKQKRMQCAISYSDFLELVKKYNTDDIRNG